MSPTSPIPAGASPQPLTAVQMATIFAQAAAATPGVLPPNAQLALGITTQVLAAVQAAEGSGADITDADLAGLFDLYRAAQKADDAAQAAAAAGSAQKAP